MNTKQNQLPQDSEKLRDIPKWAKRYAENRTLHMFIFFIAYLILLGAIFLSVHFFLKRNFIPALIMLGLYIVGLIYFLITCDKNAASYYAKTGVPESSGLKKMGKYLSLPLIAFIIFGIIMEQRGIFPAYLRMPFSATFICPLLIFANWRWMKSSIIGYLWTTLYGAWAVAIIFKVPILTFSQGGQLNPGDEMYLAIPVTGVITGLVSYFYSRYALKKLKEAAHLQENNNG
ncbi:MAG TPA: hypothetical protein HPP87_00765 [Planctomycetes bacterium]|nr:hypothetical protein [Planctomycetota bacterium]